MSLRKVRMENNTVVAVYDWPDEFTPLDAFEHETLQLGDQFFEDGRIIKFVPPPPEPVPTLPPYQDPVKLQEQIHMMLVELLYVGGSQ